MTTILVHSIASAAAIWGSDGILDGLSSPTINISTPRCAEKGMQAPDAELQVSSVPGRYDLSRKAIEEARPSALGGSELRLDSGDGTAAAINSLLLNRHPLAQRTRNDNIAPIELQKQLDDLYPPEVIVTVLPKRLHRSLGYTPLLRLSELVHHTLKQPALLQEAHVILELGLGSGRSDESVAGGDRTSSKSGVIGDDEAECIFMAWHHLHEPLSTSIGMPHGQTDADNRL
ncbi:hypothetical protein FIBSPDRAFT_1022680 [Athelia psychrophila]|uniref:Uncharacterized protein n=1 Tax=Athelia psychrophila TaxID=1759441 RepID=A0A167TG31_9AGAM|nr:hypothetical protein FIBSPDRAFT_1022680 [Fibularhizoctonia sp. CBS 109695]